MKPSIISLAALLIAVIWMSSARADTPAHIEISNTSVCALTDAGEIVCWGFPSALTADEPEGEFTDIALGPNDGCAISVDATVSCWGQGYDYVRAQADGMSEEVLRPLRRRRHVASRSQRPRRGRRPPLAATTPARGPLRARSCVGETQRTTARRRRATASCS